VTLRTSDKKKFLLPFGDIHIGHANSDLDLMQGYLDWAKEKDAWILLMGDLIENNNKRSVGAGVYEQTMNPDDQVDEVISMLLPYKDQIVGCLTGNHEERLFKDSGLDPSRLIAKVLGCPYLRYAGFLRAYVNGIPYTIYATHGGSGASTTSGKINAVQKLALIADADVYLMGHVHDVGDFPRSQKVYDKKSKTIIDRRQHFVLTGNYLTYNDSYGEMKNYIPPKLGAPRIRLDGERLDTHVSI
jgi:predicted phosphodiesterase